MSNRLQLNLSETEVLWRSFARHQHQIPTGPVHVGDTSVLPVRTVRDLRVYIDTDVTITPSNTQCASFADMYHLVDTSACTCGDKGGLLQLSSLGYFRTTEKWSYVLRLPCGQHETSGGVEDRLQHSTSVWTTLAESFRENSVPVMCSRESLHNQHGAVIPCWDPPLDVNVGVFGVLLRWGWSYRPHNAPRWMIKPSRWLLLECGMLFRRLFVLQHCCCSSSATSRRHCFSHHTLHHSV